MQIESELLKEGIISRIFDLELEIEKDRKKGIFRSENDVRKDELVDFVLYIIQVIEAATNKDEAELRALRGVEGEATE